MVAATGVILVFASNTAFNGFPVLGSILAQDGYLPRQLRTRGDRLAFSNGVLALAAGALVLILAFNADVTKLIQLYIVGVFISFTMSQIGMVRHWGRELKLAKDKALRRRMIKSRTINMIGFGMTALVLVIVLITKFEQGAWIALLAMFVLFLIMWSIRAHYDNVAKELAVDETPRPARSRPASMPCCSCPTSGSPSSGPSPTPAPPALPGWMRSPWTSTPRKRRIRWPTGTSSKSRCR